MCVECLIGKQKKPVLFKVTEPSSIPYRTHPACAKMAAYPDPPPVIPVPDTGVAQAAYAETLLPGCHGFPTITCVLFSVILAIFIDLKYEQYVCSRKRDVTPS